jgi:hypothetical protein
MLTASLPASPKPGATFCFPVVTIVTSGKVSCYCGLKDNNKMTHPRLYKRVQPVGQMAKSASIIVAPKAPVITCTVVDYSAGGACVQIFGQQTLPDRFEFLYGNVKKKARVVWRRGTRIGLVF